jgi:hypothetical protein
MTASKKVVTRPGVIATMVSTISRAKGASIEEIVAVLVEAFPDRDPMACGRRSVARSTGIAPPSITMTNVGWSTTGGNWF